MNIKTLILDFDNTIVRSNKAIIDLASKRDGKQYNIEDIKDYSFSNVLKDWDSKDVDGLFISKEFYDVLEPHEDAIETIKKLKEDGFIIKICTVTRLEGIIHKGTWIRKYLGKYIDEVIYIDNYGDSGVKMKKDSITSDLILDDHIDNLISSKTKYKIAFGNYPYNESWDGLRASNWKEFYELVRTIKNIEIN